MGGDLNLKKSWHPVLMSNQRRVWEEEKKALEERKRIEQMVKERQEERQIQELQEMQEAAGGKKRLNRVDWMYSGPSSGQVGTTEEMEGYLLGKRRVDGLLKGTEGKKLEKAATEESFMALQHANTLKDTNSKIREDPMLAIKKQEQAAYEAMMNDPVRRRQLLKAAGEESNVPKEKRHGHRSHRTHDSRRSRHHHHDHKVPESGHKRKRSGSPDRAERSRETYRQRIESSSHSRSPSPYRRRSPSPYYKSRKPQRRRSKSPERHRDDHIHRLKQFKSWSGSSRRDDSPPVRESEPSKTDERGARLAAMQQAASELDQDREKRIAAMAEREQQVQEVEDKARAYSAKFGGKGDFVNGLNRKAGDLDIGERMRRGKGGVKRSREDE